MENHWRQVRKQQEEAAALRLEIAALNERLQPLVHELAIVQEHAQLLGCI